MLLVITNMEIGRRCADSIMYRYCLIKIVDRKMVENIIKSDYEYMQFFFLFIWLA